MLLGPQSRRSTTPNNLLLPHRMLVVMSLVNSCVYPLLHLLPQFPTSFWGRWRQPLSLLPVMQMAKMSGKELQSLTTHLLIWLTHSYVASGRLVSIGWMFSWLNRTTTDVLLAVGRTQSSPMSNASSPSRPVSIMLVQGRRSSWTVVSHVLHNLSIFPFSYKKCLSGILWICSSRSQPWVVEQAFYQVPWVQRSSAHHCQGDVTLLWSPIFIF